MKRILFVLPSLAVGGMERVLITLANRLCASGYDVTVMILDDITDLKDQLDERISLIRRPYKKHLGSRIPYIRHTMYDDGMWETRADAEELYLYYVRDKKYDVEIAFFRGLCVKIISGSTNRRSVKLAWVHNDFRRAKGYDNNFRNIDEVKKAYSRFDRVICVSEQAREGFEEVVGDTGNTHTIYNMLPINEIVAMSREKVTPGVSRAGLHAVVAARLKDSAKGQLRLISAVSRLRGEGEDISLSIVGGGNDYELLRDEIERRNAASYIALEGEQRNPYPYIAQSDVLVCSSYYEGYNLTVAEALILGVPVLSTDCTGPNEILDRGRYGMIVENSEEGLYKGLRELCRDPALLAEYREKAKQRQSFFDEDKILKQITDLF